MTTATGTFDAHRLANGLQIVGQRMPDMESVSVCFFVRTGSRDEHDPALDGVSHFLEHMVFKGTAHRDAERITLDFNRMGAEFNAYTSFEQTVFYARVLGQYLPQAIDLLADLMRPRLDGNDFSMEKNVILEEIARAEDQPTSQAYRQLMQAYFAGDTLGHDVLGSKESIRDLSVELMRAYQAERYAANNLVLALAGNYDWAQVVELAEQHCGAWKRGEEGRIASEIKPAPATKVVTKAQLKQQMLMTAVPAPSVEDDAIYAYQVMATILGDSSGSRLFWNIFQKGLAEGVGASMTPLDHTGLMVAYVSTTPENAKHVLDLLRAELESMQRDGVHEDELRRAKDKIISRTVLDGESTFSRMQEIVYSWVARNEMLTLDEEIARFEAVTVADIQRVLARYPLTAPQVFLAYGPLEASALDLATA
ncbi:MAG TPA: pitrilysin family protein [Ktedonobacterales bacterium]